VKNLPTPMLKCFHASGKTAFTEMFFWKLSGAIGVVI